MYNKHALCMTSDRRPPALFVLQPKRRKTATSLYSDRKKIEVYHALTTQTAALEGGVSTNSM